MNDPFASVCRACNARNAFGPSAYAEEPVAPPPTKRTPLSPAAIARWGIAFAAVLVCARMVLWCYARSHSRHELIIEPVTLATFAPPAASTMSLAEAAKRPPARKFALTPDGRAVSFEGDHLKVHATRGGSHDVADVTGPLGPRGNSPIVAFGDSAYWITADEMAIASVRLLDWKPSLYLKSAQPIGELGVDTKAIWYTASDGQSGRRLFRVDVTSKPTPIQVATWPAQGKNERMVVTDTDVIVAISAGITRFTKNNGKTTTIVPLAADESVGALAVSSDAVYFTTSKIGEPVRDLYRAPLAGGERTKLLASPGEIGDVVVSGNDIVIADRPQTSWQVDTIPNGDAAQITIMASDVGRQPRLRVSSSGRVAWSTSEGVSFDSN